MTSETIGGLAALKLTSLSCDHCGGDAITSPDGMFGDGDGGKCDECAFPGNVGIDDVDDDNVFAYWLVSDEGGDRCNRAECEECHDR